MRLLFIRALMHFFKFFLLEHRHQKKFRMAYSQRNSFWAQFLLAARCENRTWGGWFGSVNATFVPCKIKFSFTHSARIPKIFKIGRFSMFLYNFIPCQRKTLLKRALIELGSSSPLSNCSDLKAIWFKCSANKINLLD